MLASCIINRGPVCISVVRFNNGGVYGARACGFFLFRRGELIWVGGVRAGIVYVLSALYNWPTTTRSR